MLLNVGSGTNRISACAPIELSILGPQYSAEDQLIVKPARFGCISAVLLRIQAFWFVTVAGWVLTDVSAEWRLQVQQGTKYSS